MCLVLGPLTAKRLSKLDPVALSRVNEALSTLKMQEGFGVTADAIVIMRSMALYLYIPQRHRPDDSYECRI